MHIREKTSNVIATLNGYKNKETTKQVLIKEICEYFDIMKEQNLNQGDLKFLKYISSFIGIPHFYDMLKSFNKDINIENIDLNTFSSLLAESTLHLTDDIKIHKYQKEIYDKFCKNKLNRFFLSASTSFGKTHLVFDIMRKMGYNNILLIFPTIALLAENFEKLLSNKNYEYFKNNYRIHTLSEVNDDTLGKKNIFIYTPERFLSYMDKINQVKNFDFVFIDEIYKIDNEYLIDEELKENERDTAYRLATFYALTPKTDTLLAGPYIEFANNSFKIFLKKNKIELLNYNDYEIVNKSYISVGSKKKILFGDKNIDLSNVSTRKGERLLMLVSAILDLGNNENVIIYCNTKNSAEKNIRMITEKLKLPSITDHSFLNFLEHIKQTIGEEWGLYKALKNRMAFHHGLVPKYMQKEIIRLFNAGEIKILCSTTTITEGVNTSAKNIIVTIAKKERKALKKFDAKNIAGRAGRFLQHYSGRVFIIDINFNKILEEDAEPIKHKNYDINAPKGDVDLVCTPLEYQSKIDRVKNAEIEKKVSNSKLPAYIFDQYKIIKRIDKVELYNSISKLSKEDISIIEKCIHKIHYKNILIDLDGFQKCIEIIAPFVKNKNLSFLITNKGKENTNPYSTLNYLVNFYLKGGFHGLFEYKVNEQKERIDKAISDTSNFVYNLLKYQLVKYLGIFNLIYKYHIAHIYNKIVDDVHGFDRLLSKLEYNALSDEARIASDYGVTANIINYYENYKNRDKAKEIHGKFDNFEKDLFKKIQRVIK